MHPSSTNGVSVQYEIATAGTVQVTGGFARANDSQNSGDGVNVGIYLNDLSTPVFEASISSDHQVNAVIGGDVFAGTGSVSFNQTISVQENDVLLFVVFAGDNSDASFDVTAFRGTVSQVPDALVNFYQDFSGQQGANGITSVVVPSASNANPAALVFDAEVSLGNGSQTSGDFARANDSPNSGDGVNVGVYLNDLSTPIFEASVSSEHDVNAAIGEDVFAGTGSVCFDQTISVQENDILLFVVFAGDNSDAAFDVTAFRGAVLEVPEIILGDVNKDGVVNFLDIRPFIGILSSGGFQAEADFDENETVDFLDIRPFIAILSGG